MKKLISNLVLSASVVVAVWLVLEVSFALNLHRLPLRYHGFLPPPLRLIAQSSKKGLLPKKYVAVFGDSYAQGKGDWLFESSHWRNPPFAAQHVLTGKISRDVVSFGQGGHGNLAGFLRTPLSLWRMLNQTWLYKIGLPEDIVVYFYEGNDLNDNLLELAVMYRPYFPISKVNDPATFRAFIEGHVIHPGLVGKIPWYRNLVFIQFVASLLKPKKVTAEDSEEFYPGEINRILVGGDIMAVPDRLQSPALELSPGEMELALHSTDWALAYLKKIFPGSRIMVVYIPSVLSCYRLAGDQVSIQSFQKRQEIYPSRQVSILSELIVSRVRSMCVRLNVFFLDVRPKLREAAGEELIHGPRDWWHFNRRGYEILAGEIAAAWPAFQEQKRA